MTEHVGSLHPESAPPQEEHTVTRDTYIRDAAIAYEVAEAEQGKRDTIADLKKMQATLGKEKSEAYDQVIEDFTAAAQKAGNAALQKIVEKQENTARLNILDIVETKETERKTFSTKETYLSHATLFYKAIDKEHSAKPENEGIRAIWQEANILMATSALMREEPPEIADAYYKKVQDPAQKWGLVAKAHRSGNSMLAQRWEEPLLQSLEDEHNVGQIPITTTLALFKAKTSMAADRLRIADKRADRKQYAGEMEEQWSKAQEAMGRSRDLAPKYGKESIAQDEDKRQQMLDFAKLFYEVGDFKTGDTILGQVKEINKYAERQTFNLSDEATKAVKDFVESAELRQLCYGMTPQEVRKHASKWLNDKKNTQETRWAMSLIAGMSDSHEKQIGNLDPEKRHAKGASNFLIEQFPELVEPYLLDTVSLSLRAGEWDKAFGAYYGSVFNYYRNSTLEENVESMAEALEIAQYGPQFEQSDVFKAAYNDTEHIKLIAAAYAQRVQEVDTADRTNLRDAAIEDINRFYKREYGSPELNATFAIAVFDALKAVSPDGTYSKIKAYMKLVLAGSFNGLKSIPGNSEELTAQRALLSTALAKAETE